MVIDGIEFFLLSRKPLNENRYFTYKIWHQLTIYHDDVTKWKRVPYEATVMMLLLLVHNQTVLRINLVNVQVPNVDHSKHVIYTMRKKCYFTKPVYFDVRISVTYLFPNCQVTIPAFELNWKIMCLYSKLSLIQFHKCGAEGHIEYSCVLQGHRHSVCYEY